jgi:heparosan-N-sulfate-glucuronate 5-epimerase
MKSLQLRRPQLRAPFEAGDPRRGYYNDLTHVEQAVDGPERGLEAMRALTADRSKANPIVIAQLGLGAWQRREEDARWLDVVRAGATWLSSERDDDGVIRYRFGLTHTFRLGPGWSSAMAQGESASLFVRAADALSAPELLDEARRFVGPLIDPASQLVAATPEGPVLQEYPTEPPSHVLNGWIFALWGLYDVAHSLDHPESLTAFERSADALAARLPRYSIGFGWSRYDLFPHAIKHAASPFYHRLHIEQLRALDALSSRPAFLEHADAWEAGFANPAVRALALTRKVAFRVLNPRRS